MANNKDFIIKNALEVGKDTKTTLGTITENIVGYSLADASYDSVSFSVVAQDTAPVGAFFKPDGTKMYITGGTGDSVYEYTLSTAWDISTASYSSSSLSTAALDVTPQDVYFKSDGTKLYLVGATSDTIYQYSLSTAWDVSTGTYDSVSFSVSSQDISPTGIFFKPDGTEMFIVGNSNDSVYQYSLSTAWDISTASYSQSFSVASQDTAPQGLFFDPDGTEMFIVGNSNDSVYQYSLSTSWDISTASYSDSFSVTSQDTAPTDVCFGYDGSRMFILGSTNDTIYQYSTGYNAPVVDLSTGNYFADTLAADTTYTFSNAGDVQAFQLEVTGASTYTITWPNSVEWTAGVAPSAPGAGETDVYTFVTDDAGTTYIGLQTADNLS